MKTVKDYLNGLPEPIKSQALKNMNPYFENAEVSGVYQALITAFIWDNTHEGAKYWEGVAKTLRALDEAASKPDAPKSEYVAQTHLYKVKESTHTIGRVSSSENVEHIARKCYADGDIGIYESFHILMLARNNEVKAVAKISQGGVAGTVVDGKLVAKYAVEMMASAVIFVHNHPSGNLKPSIQDINLTKKLKEGLQLLDIQVLDHLILTEDSYYSFADEGRI